MPHHAYPAYDFPALRTIGIYSNIPVGPDCTDLLTKPLVNDSGVDESVTDKFPGSTITVGSAASGAGNNRDIPPEEGGDIDARGRMSKARDFEGEGGPETKAQRELEENPGSDSIRSNIRDHGDSGEARDRR